MKNKAIWSYVLCGQSPLSQETCEGKVTQLYFGLGYEQIVKMEWTIPPEPGMIWRHWHMLLRFFTRALVAEREQSRVHQTVWRKVPPIHPKKTDFGWWVPDACNPNRYGKEAPILHYIVVIIILQTNKTFFYRHPSDWTVLLLALL